jgi:hypothetical protein
MDIAELLPTIAANPDTTEVGVALIMVAFRARQRHPPRSRRDDWRTIATTFLCGKRASVSVASRDGDTGARLSFRRPSRLFPGERRFRYFARFHRNLLQPIDKPSAGGARR